MDFELELRILLDILLAALLGFCIGFERKMRAKEAGIRTHTIVCVGSALMMCVSKFGFSGADTARVAAQIVSGIGFLGAGIIVYRKHEVHGLTTASGIWATAGIGMACGARLYILAAGASLVLIGSQILLHMPWKIFKMKKAYTLKIVFEDCEGSREKIKELFGFEVYVRLLLERQGEKLIYKATIHTEKEYRSEFLEKVLKEHPYILSIERTDDN